MKKKYIIPGLLAAVSVVGLSACDDSKSEKKLADLTISGYTENFDVGDSFAKGNLKVEAKYSDDSVVDVTNDSDLKITAPTSLSQPGTYAVIVSYGGLSEAYQIKVTSSGEGPVATLTELVITGAKTNFSLGDVFVSTGLKVEAKYSDLTTKDVTNDVKVEGPTVLNEVGTYAVIVSYGGVSKAYQINVTSSGEGPVALLNDISVTGAKTDFLVGDDFVTTGLKVEAKYSDLTTKDVTSDVKVEGPSKLNKPGTYAVIVSYGGISKVYQITVDEVHKTLDRIVVNTTGTKLNYIAGVAVDDLSYDVSLNYHYEDDNNVESVEVVTDLSDYTKTVTDADGNVVTGTISAHGIYTVTFTKGDDSASFDIVVDPDLSTVEKAIAVGVDSQSHVKKVNTSILESSDYFGSESLMEKTEAEFGDDYVVLANYDRSNLTYYTHLFKSDAILAGINLEPNDDDPSVYDKQTRPFEKITEDDFKGHNFNAFSYPIGIEGVLDENLLEKNAYGTDGLIENLYLYAVQNKNGDFKQYVEYNAGYYTYHFTFGFYGNGLKYGSKGFSLYDVSFNLGDDYIFDNVKVVKTNYEASAVTKGEDNYYTLNSDAEVSNVLTVVIDQVEGDRDLVPTFAVEDYYAEDVIIKDSEDNVISDGDTFKAELGKSVVLSLEANPELISWILDEPKIEMEGVYAYFNSNTNTINFTIYTAGVYTLEIQTENTFTSITVEVDKVDPETMSVQQFIANQDNPNQAALSDDISSLKIALGKPVYLYGVPKAGGNADNTDGSKYAMSLVGNVETATLETVNLDYKDGIITVWEFNPTAAGTYVVEVSSTVEGCEDVKTTVTIEVVDASSIDLARDILAGRYVCESDPWYQLSENLSVTFIPASDGALTGTVALAAKYSSGGWGGTTKLFNALYTYSFDADTKEFTLDKISSNVDGNVTFSITMISDLYEMNVDLTFANIMIKDLSVGDKQTDSPDLTNWQGNWVSEDETITLTVEDDTITYSDGTTSLSGSVLALSSNCVLLLDGSNTIFELDVYGTSISCTIADKTVTLPKEVVKDKFETKWQGTWNGENNIKLVITANELTFYDGDMTWGGTADVTDQTTITLDDSGYIAVFTLNEDGTISCKIQENDPVTLTKEVVEDKFAAKWQGTWNGENDIKLVITANELTFYDGDMTWGGTADVTDQTTITLDDSGYIAVFTLNEDETISCKIQENNPVTLTKEVPADLFPTVWQGVWTGGNASGDTSYSLTVDANDFTLLMNDERLEGTVKLISVDDTTLVLENTYSFGVDTFTLTLNGNVVTFIDPMSSEEMTLTKTGTVDPNPTPDPDPSVVEFDDTWLGTYIFYDSNNDMTFIVVIEKNNFTYVENDEEVSGSFTVEGNDIKFVPDSSLACTFTVDVENSTLTDDLGNVYNKRNR